MKIRPLLLALFAAVATPALAQPTHVASWPTADLPLGIALGSNGWLYVTTQAGATVRAHIYDPTGIEQGQIPGPSFEAYGIGFLGNGELAIADYSPHVVRLYAAGTLVGAWSAGGTNSGFLTIDGADNLYITDDAGDRIRKFDSAGNLLLSWRIDHPAGPAYFNGRIYVAEMFTQTMRVFLPDSTLVGTFSTAGTLRAEQIGVDSSGNLLVTDWDGRKLRCFTPQGVLLWTVGPTIPGYAAGTCRFTSVAAGPNGLIYAGDFDHRRVVVLREEPTAALPSTWGKVKDQYRR